MLYIYTYICMLGAPILRGNLGRHPGLCTNVQSITDGRKVQITRQSRGFRLRMEATMSLYGASCVHSSGLLGPGLLAALNSFHSEHF